MLSTNSLEALLAVIRLGIGHQVCALPQDVDWDAIKLFTERQGLSAVVVDGLGLLPREAMPPQMTLIQWVGEVVQDYEVRYRQYVRAITDMVSFYNAQGFRLMVLKGYACSLDWPKPQHRPCGDIDIWLFGMQKEADAFLESVEFRVESSNSSKFRRSKFKIDNSHHHHSVFEWQGFMVENHFDFINTHAHRSSRRYEAKLKELAYRACTEKVVDGVTVYLPGADFNFLFLLRHMANHFVGKEMTVRQLLDWALFIEHHHDEIDWKEDLAFVEAHGLLRYFNLMALISVERLGFSRSIFHCELKEDELKGRVFRDIIEPECHDLLGQGALGIMVGKMRRWWRNRWKHRLCYPDSLLSGFVYGVWAKIQKPAHFLH